MPKPQPFKPAAYSHGPHAHTAHDAGGRLISAPLNRQQFQADLDRYAPGCGTPTYIPGTNGGQVPCGGELTLSGKTERHFCPACQARIQRESKVATIVNSLLEADEFDPREYLLNSGETGLRHFLHQHGFVRNEAAQERYVKHAGPTHYCVDHVTDERWDFEQFTDAVIVRGSADKILNKLRETLK